MKKNYVLIDYENVQPESMVALDLEHVHVIAFHIGLIAAQETRATSLAERVATVRANLLQRGSSRPRTVKTLGGTIKSLFQNGLSEKDMDAIIQELVKQGTVSITQNKVTYG
jgi:hypothetical protein